MRGRPLLSAPTLLARCCASTGTDCGFRNSPFGNPLAKVSCSCQCAFQQLSLTSSELKSPGALIYVAGCHVPSKLALQDKFIRIASQDEANAGKAQISEWNPAFDGSQYSCHSLGLYLPLLQGFSYMPLKDLASLATKPPGDQMHRCRIQKDGCVSCFWDRFGSANPASTTCPWRRRSCPTRAS